MLASFVKKTLFRILYLFLELCLHNFWIRDVYSKSPNCRVPSLNGSRTWAYLSLSGLWHLPCQAHCHSLVQCSDSIILDLQERGHEKICKRIHSLFLKS